MKVLSDLLHKAGILKESPENYSSGGYSLLVRNTTTGRLENVSSSFVLPDQTGNSGKYLTTDGSNASWVAIGGTVPTGGTAGQILAKIDGTNYNTEWIDNYTTDVREEVKAGEAINKGQAVYISGADGTNPIVSKASNATEATSSKTLGLLFQNLAQNGQGFVITEGRLSGLDTSTATVADPVWLGTNGNLLFGLANKPVAPAHLVYLGVVTRVNANNGEIFIHVQNGFELQELHNVLISTPTDGQVLKYESSTGLWKNGTDASSNIYNSNGTLTANRTVTMSNRSLTFSGSSTSTVVTATGKLLVGGATESASYNMRVTGSADVSFYLNVGNLIDTVNLYASATTNTFTSIITGFGEFTNQASAPVIPSAGTGRLYSKTDNKIYWRNSTGTEFDLTATGTVTSVELATGTTGTNVNITGSPITSSGTITINIPDAATTARGLVTTGTQTIGGEKTFRTDNGLPITTYSFSSATSTVSTLFRIQNFSSGTTANGFGAAIEYYIETDANLGWRSNRIISKWSNAANASRTSEFVITGVSSTTEADLFTLAGSGALKLNKYGVNAFIGTPAYSLAVDALGNVIETAFTNGTVTGSGTQNYITKWNNAGGTAIGNSLIYDNGTNVLIGSITSVQGALQVTQNGGGILVRTDNSNFGLGVINTASSNKAWDITPFNNNLAINESNVGTHYMLFAGGNTAFGSITDAGYKVDINGTLRTQGDFSIADAKNIILQPTTGTKIGTATSQKLAFWNATPIVQPTTSIAEATFVENSGGTAVNVDSTFAGYTLQQIAQALKDTGLIA